MNKKVQERVTDKCESRKCWAKLTFWHKFCLLGFHETRLDMAIFLWEHMVRKLGSEKRGGGSISIRAHLKYWSKTVLSRLISTSMKPNTVISKTSPPPPRSIYNTIFQYFSIPAISVSYVLDENKHWNTCSQNKNLVFPVSPCICLFWRLHCKDIYFLVHDLHKRTLSKLLVFPHLY